MDEPLPPPGLPPEHEDDDSGERGIVLQSLYSGRITLRLAAERLASLSLEGDDLGAGLLDTWSVIHWDAEHSAAYHQILSELLATIASLPPARDDEGNQLTINNNRIWGKSERCSDLQV